jgi:hypothetical protein
MKLTYSYDSKCWDLASAFASDWDVPHEHKKKLLDDLAQHIQDSVEQFEREQNIALMADSVRNGPPA